MAYTAANLSEIAGTLVWNATTGHKVWVYRSADTFTTVKAASYITDALARGMSVLDTLFVIDTASPAVTLCTILTVPSTGATVSQTGTSISS
jgi:hypothetical protein